MFNVLAIIKPPILSASRLLPSSYQNITAWTIRALTAPATPGATNVLRSGKKSGRTDLARRCSKGLVAVILARCLQDALDLSDATIALVAIAALVGHMWPIFFNFKGGKGVATALRLARPLPCNRPALCLNLAGHGIRFQSILPRCTGRHRLCPNLRLLHDATRLLGMGNRIHCSIGVVPP